MSQTLLAPDKFRLGFNRDANPDRSFVLVANNTGVFERSAILIESFEAGTIGANFQSSKFRGTATAPADVVKDDLIGGHEWDTYSAVSGNCANMFAYVDDVVVSGQGTASRISIQTALTNTAVRNVAHFSREGYFALGTAFDLTAAATRPIHPFHAVQSGVGAAFDAHFEAYEAANGTHLHLVRSRGTFAVPSNVVVQDTIGRLIATAYSGSLLDTAEIRFAIDAAVTNAQRPATRLAFYTNANNAASRQVGYFSNAGFFGLGIAFDPTVAATSAAYDVHAAKLDSVGRLQMQFQGFGTAADGPYIAVAHARGTFAAPTNNVDGDNLGDFEFYAYAGGWLQSAEIRAFVTGTVVDATVPSSNMIFRVATGGAMATRMQLFSTGRIGIGSAARATEADAASFGAAALWAAENGNRTPIAFQYSADDTNSAIMLGRKSRGTVSAPTSVANGDNLAAYRPGAYAGQWFDDCGYIQFAVDDTVVSTQRPAIRIEFAVNLNNASASVAMRINSDKKFIAGASMTNFTDAKFNYNLAGGADEIAATWGQAGGGANFILGFATYSAGYTNGHPARMNLVDNNFGVNIRFEHKKTGASSNTLVSSLYLVTNANMPNAAFFSTAGSFGGGQGVIFIGNRDTAPTSNPVAGGLLYAASGALRYRGSAGTDVQVAAA